MRILATVLWGLMLAVTVPVSHAVQCTSDAPPSNPDGAYQDHGDGTVTDTRSGLMWKRCSEGQSWTGSTCNGMVTTHVWSAAMELAEGATFAGYSDWRVPNIKELNSLVEVCRVSPAINDAVFPNSSDLLYWSSSPHTAKTEYAWKIGFDNGFVNESARRHNLHVRLVRSGGH